MTTASLRKESFQFRRPSLYHLLLHLCCFSFHLKGLCFCVFADSLWPSFCIANSQSSNRCSTPVPRNLILKIDHSTHIFIKNARLGQMKAQRIIDSRACDLRKPITREKIAIKITTAAPSVKRAESGFSDLFAVACVDFLADVSFMYKKTLI